MKKWQKKAIREILEEFNFAKVNRVMLALGWTWHHIGRTPEIGELKKMAERLLTETTIGEGNPCYVSSGGFEAICDTEKKAMRLLFITEEWEASK